MTNSINSTPVTGKSALNSMQIQKDLLKQVISPVSATTAKASSTSVVANQVAIIPSPAVRLNLSPYAQSNLVAPQSSPMPAASAAPATLTMTMGDSKILGYDQQANLVQTLATPTNEVKITVNLVKGETYTVAAGYGYRAPVGATPSFTLKAQSASNVIDGTFTGTPQTGLTGSFTATSSGAYTLTLTSSTGTTLASLNLQMNGKSNLPTLSGDTNVDALLQGKNAWWHNPGTAPVQGLGGTVINGPLRSLVSGSSSSTLTYGFLSAAPTSASANDKTGFKAISDSNEKAAVKAAFDYISSITNLTFKEVDTSTGGVNDAANINFGNNLQTTSDGYAYSPNNSSALGKTYVYINNKIPSDLGNFTSGTYGWATIFHETGHALGLKHPGDYNAGLAGNTHGTPPYLPTNTDNHQYSIMSYNDNLYTTGINNSSYMPYDIEALQYLYGVKSNGTTAIAGAFDFSNATPTSTYLKTLWSNTGSDQIKLTNITNSSIVNLNAGSFSSINIINNTNRNQNNVGIAYGSKINTVTLSTNASTNDKVILNSAYVSGGFDNVYNLTSGDKLSIKTAIFGNLTANNISIGTQTTASNANSKLIVNTATNDVYFDADGNAAGSQAIKIAHYTKASSFSASLTTSNFEFIA